MEGECGECKKKRLQRKPIGEGSTFDVPPIVGDVLRTPGHPLDRRTRDFMESRFAHDFSGVRVHTDTQAAASARTVKAHAFTVGQHVVFGAGRYSPGTAAGHGLLAHELTHVVQQHNGLRADAGGSSSEAEREASLNESRLHSAEPLTFAARPAPFARRGAGKTTVEVEAPTQAPGCTLAQHRKIYPAAQLAIQWLDRSIDRLSSYLTAPDDRANRATREALTRHFHSTDEAVVRQVVDRVATIRNDIDSARAGTQFQVECHTDADTECGHANAYVTGDQNMLVFCPIFFGWDEPSRAESIVHEMAHAVNADITDRGYRNDRVLPVLSTAEALTNAESFGLLVQELGTGNVPNTNAPRDSVARDCRDIEPQVRIAIARGQRWNRAGETRVKDSAPEDMIRRHLGDDTPEIRQAAYDFYHGAASGLGQSLDFVCDRECGGRVAFGQTAADHTGLGAGIGAAIGGVLGLIGGGLLGAAAGAVGLGIGVGLLAGLGLGGLIGAAIGSAVSHGPRIHLCPDWKDQSVESDRIESVLRATYEALGKSPEDSLKYAKLAREINEQFFPIPH